MKKFNQFLKIHYIQFSSNVASGTCHSCCE